ncbi:hypothetical protein [Legionella impletisoli]|uniref:Enhanced entry protein EnhB n=1 Tax=Legionella impletisoli TaxID=343510 RepID=A0A917JWH4_9GAMM|nr:hypothetical protein [Legionella impletisoli]GGI87203.1 hypothetical protein GCM10007966_14910 [Legionella impletisoli]
MRYFVPLLLGVVAFHAQAEETLPFGCKPVAVTEETVKLKASKSALVMIHNWSTSDLWITHPVSDPGASAGWSSRLQAGNWSALALTEKEFELSCIESKPGHEQQIPCSGVLSVCKYTNIAWPLKSDGSTYWAGEDQSLNALKSYIGRRGFVIPVSQTSEE